jgi:hypothetical protein
MAPTGSIAKALVMSCVDVAHVPVRIPIGPAVASVPVTMAKFAPTPAAVDKSYCFVRLVNDASAMFESCAVVLLIAPAMPKTMRLLSIDSAVGDDAPELVLPLNDEYDVEAGVLTFWVSTKKGSPIVRHPRTAITTPNGVVPITVSVALT